MKIGTVNVKASLSDAAAETALMRVLNRHPQLTMVQEWGPGRARILDRLPTHLEAQGKSRPIIVDRTALTPLHTFMVTLAHGRRVSKLPGRRKALPPSTARVVICRSVRTGLPVIGINYHLPAAVETNGRPRRAAGAARLAQHAEAVGALAALFATCDRFGDAYAAGDSNVDYTADEREQYDLFPVVRMDRAGAIPCWYMNEPARRDGTHGRRLIDTVWSDRPASDVVQIPTASDHDGVVATYGPASV